MIIIGLTVLLVIFSIFFICAYYEKVGEFVSVYYCVIICAFLYIVLLLFFLYCILQEGANILTVGVFVFELSPMFMATGIVLAFHLKKKEKSNQDECKRMALIKEELLK